MNRAKNAQGDPNEEHALGEFVEENAQPDSSERAVDESEEPGFDELSPEELRRFRLVSARLIRRADNAQSDTERAIDESDEKPVLADSDGNLKYMRDLSREELLLLAANLRVKRIPRVSYAQWLHVAMGRHGISNAALAKAYCQVDPSVKDEPEKEIGAWRRGKACPDLTRAFRVGEALKALGVPAVNGFVSVLRAATNHDPLANMNGYSISGQMLMQLRLTLATFFEPRDLTPEERERQEALHELYGRTPIDATDYLEECNEAWLAYNADKQFPTDKNEKPLSQDWTDLFKIIERMNQVRDKKLQC